MICISIVILILTGCNGGKDCSNKNTKCVEDWNNKDVKEITIYKKDSMGNKGVTGIVQEQKKIDTFLKAMQTAESIPGDLKVSPPDYEAEIVLKDNKMASSLFQLWLPSESDGMIVYLKNTSQGNKLTIEQNKEIKAIIESVRIHPSK